MLSSFSFKRASKTGKTVSAKAVKRLAAQCASASNTSRLVPSVPLDALDEKRLKRDRRTVLDGAGYIGKAKPVCAIQWADVWVPADFEYDSEYHSDNNEVDSENNELYAGVKLRGSDRRNSQLRVCPQAPKKSNPPRGRRFTQQLCEEFSELARRSGKKHRSAAASFAAVADELRDARYQCDDPMSSEDQKCEEEEYQLMVGRRNAETFKRELRWLIEQFSDEKNTSEIRGILENQLLAL